jgi:anaerobic selenocysteine-containing dehydrogenase
MDDDRPMLLRPGATHYQPIDWDDAFALIARAPHLAQRNPMP